MTKTTMGWILTLILSLMVFFPLKSDKTNPYELQIKSLAFSYGIFNQTICPNKKNLIMVKHEYMKQIPITKVAEREWIDKNFDSIFTSECLMHEKQRIGE